MFGLSAFYGLTLAVLILSFRVTPMFIGIFCDLDTYRLGNFGQIWKDWHAFGCAYVGLTNLVVYLDSRGVGFSPSGRRSIALCSTFIFGTWGVQNTFYCLGGGKGDFHPAMWINAISCLIVAAAAFQTAAQMTVAMEQLAEIRASKKQ